MFQDKFIFAQLTSFLDRNHFNYLVRKYDGDRYVKSFTCWNQLMALMFGQLCNRESLRDVVVALEAHQSKCYHLGMGRNPIAKTTFATANQNRDYRIFEDFAFFMIEQARKKRATDIFKLKGNVYAFDSTTIPNSVTSLGGYCFDCCLGLTEVHANRETPPATGYDIFHTCISLQTIYVPTGASANYDIDPWNAYKIVEEGVQSGITAVTVKGETVAPVYHLNGSRAGTTKSFSTQPKGIYIVNGKKVLR